MATYSKGTLLRVHVEVDEERIKQMRRFPDLAMQAMQAGADYWHSGILPKHFEKSAHGRYGYAQRSIDYLKRKNGKPDLVSSGSLRNDLKAKAAYTIRGAKVTLELKMSARVLNFVPNMADTDVNYYVQRRNGSNYPNMKREVRAITDSELDAVATVVATQLEILLGPTDDKNTKLLMAK